MTDQQAANQYIRAYQHGQDTILLTDGKICWDVTPAIGFRNIAHFMADLAHGMPTSNWPFTSKPWPEHRQEINDADIRLVAELVNPGQPDETLAISTMNMTDKAVRALAMHDNSTAFWKDPATLRANRKRLREAYSQSGNVNAEPPVSPSDRLKLGPSLEATPIADGVWESHTDYGWSGLILSQERWEQLPPEVQYAVEHPRFPSEFREEPIVTSLLGLTDLNVLKMAIRAAKANYTYDQALPHLEKVQEAMNRGEDPGPYLRIRTILPSPHYHLVAHQNNYTGEEFRMYFNRHDAQVFAEDQENIQTHGLLEVIQCSRKCGQ